MSIGIIIFILIVCVIAGIATIYFIKQEENKQKSYEEAGDKTESELERSLEYEKSSLKSNVPTLIWIYVVTITLSLVVLAIYIF